MGLPKGLGGVFVPAVTPFDPVSGDVDLDALRSNIRSLVRAPLGGIVVAGSTGESVLLEPSERIALVGAAREVVPDDRALVAGTGLESTRGTIHMSRDAADAGADAVLVQPPSFYRGAMDKPTLEAHYRAVADVSPVPVILYQVPPRLSTIELDTALVGRLAEHPNVIGVKDSRGDLSALAEWVERVPAEFAVLVGEARIFYGALGVGAVGAVLAAANLVPEMVCALFEAFSAGRSSEAGRIQETLGQLAKGILGRFGVPGIKAALDLLGERGGLPRSPLQPLGPEGVGTVRDVLLQAGLAVPA